MVLWHQLDASAALAQLASDADRGLSSVSHRPPALAEMGNRGWRSFDSLIRVRTGEINGAARLVRHAELK